MAADASITAVVDLDIGKADKQLTKLKEEIEKTERKINEYSKKSSFAENLSNDLGMAKARLKELQDMLDPQGEKYAFSADFEGFLKAKEEAQQLEEKIKKLEPEVEKARAAAEKYDQKLVDALNTLEEQKEAYGELERKILDAANAQEQSTKVSGENIGEKFQEEASEIERARADVEKAVNSIKEAIARLPETAERIFPGINDAFNNITGKAQETFDKVASAAKEALPEGITSGIKSIVSSFELVFSRLSENVSDFAKDYAANVLVAIRRIKERLSQEKVTPEIETDGFDDLVESSRDATNGLESLDKELKQKPEDAKQASNALGGMGRVAGVLSKMFETAKNALAGFVRICANGLKKAAKSFPLLAKNVLSAVKNMNVLTKLSDKLGGVFHKLGSMIRRVFVFSVLTSFFRSLRTQMTEYLGLNNELMTALGRLKSALATAFQPILTTVIPLLTSLMNVLTRVISVIAQFIAALFGTTAKQAQQNAKELNEQAKATEAAGNAAEEASKQLAGFDEINQLSFDNGGGGGADAAQAGEALFDLDLDDTVFKSWGEAFSAFLDHILNEGIPKLKEGLNNFADWLNWFSDNLLEMFTFPGVYDKVVAIGDEIAKAINDMINRINWNQLGQAFGAGMNLLVAGLVAALYGIDWIGLGRHFAELVNGLVSQVDWYQFGQLLWAGFKIGLETLAGFLVGLNMPQLAQAASDIVIGFFDAVKDTIDRIPWGEIGAQIARFWQNIKWVEIFQSVYDAVISVLEGLRGLIVGFLSEFGDWTKPLVDIVNTLFDAVERVMEITKEWASTIDFEPIKNAFYNLNESISHLVSVLTDGMLWAYENVLLLLAGWAIEESVPVVVNLLAAALELMATVIEKMAPITQFLWEKVLIPIGKFAWDVLEAGIVNLTRAIEALTDILNGTYTFRDYVNDVIAAAGELIPGVVEGIRAGWQRLKDFLSEVWQSIVDGFKSFFGINSPSTVMAEQGGFLIEGLLQGITTAWESITAFFGEALSALKENLLLAWEEMRSNTAEKWEEIRSNLFEKWENIKQNVSESAQNVRDKISEVWENTKQSTIEKWSEIQNSLKNSWENIKSNGTAAFQGLKDSVVSIFSGMWDAIKGVINSILGGIEKMANGVINGINSVISALNSLNIDIPDWVPAIGGESLGFNIQKLKNVTIPRLAAGAVIPPNREFMAVLGDQSNGRNLEAPEGLLRQIVREESGGGNDQLVMLLEAILDAVKAGKVMQADGRAIAKIVTNEQNRMTRMSGTPVLLR